MGTFDLKKLQFEEYAQEQQKTHCIQKQKEKSNLFPLTT